MPLYVSAGDSKSFTPAPEGTHQAVCVDVIDKGEQPNKFKPGKTQWKIDLAWQIDERRDDGKRFVVYKRYTASLNEKASLRKDLESWRGRPFTQDELNKFDVETVIGANCLISVQHKVGQERTYANVMSVMPLLKGMPKLAAENYERKEDEPVAPSDDDAHDGPVPVDAIPF